MYFCNTIFINFGGSNEEVPQRASRKTFQIQMPWILLICFPVGIGASDDAMDDAYRDGKSNTGKEVLQLQTVLFAIEFMSSCSCV